MDWKRLLEELNEAGLSQAKIAERCSASQAAVSDLLRGATKEPRYGLGSRLLLLHEEVVGKVGKAGSAANDSDTEAAA